MKLSRKINKLYDKLDDLQEEILINHLDEGDWYYMTEEYYGLYYKIEKIEFKIRLYELLKEEKIEIL